MNHERITLQDTAITAITKLSEGNPGALRVCSELFKEGAAIDPDAFGGGLSPLLALDTHAIYGSRIWMLYKDVCKQNLTHVVAVLRAVQLGLFTESALKNGINNYGEGVDCVALFDAVCNRLPNFAKANALDATEIV